MNNSVMVIAAHPDDEVLGCGGTIARHADSGDRVQIVIVAEGETSRQLVRDHNKVKDKLSNLATAAENAANILGASGVELLKLPDNRLDSIDRLDLIKIIEERIELYKPQTVYVHHCGDVNIDHRRLHEAVITACRPTPGHPVRRMFSYEVASSTEWQIASSGSTFQANWFNDISEQWMRKQAALQAYKDEMRAWPHARSIKGVEHQARWRGAQVGFEAAEAFCLLRNLS